MQDGRNLARRNHFLTPSETYLKNYFYFKNPYKEIKSERKY